MESLESLINFWGQTEDLSTLAVFIGVVGEYITELTHCIKSRPNRRLIGKISALLLILGIAGELISQEKLATSNSLLVATLNKAAEHERSERLKLQIKFSWRHLDDDQINRIIASLQSFPNMPYDRVVSDAESLNFLSEITKIFDAPSLHWVAKGISLNGIVFHSSSGSIGVGIITDVHIVYGANRESDFGAAAKTLAGALSAEGIKAIAEPDITETQTTPNQRIHVKIGSKPIL